jgi:hypothetical protein
MAKKKKDVRPFFELRFDVSETLEALANELMMTIQALDTVIKHGDLNEHTKEILSARVYALKTVCMSRDED